LKYDLEVLALFAQFFMAEMGQILTQEANFAGSYANESQNSAGQCGFSAARFAHDSKRLASLQVETDSVNGAQNFPAMKPSVPRNFKVNA
jgi:hypothetical protein